MTPICNLIKENLAELRLIINTDKCIIPPFIDGKTDKLIFDSLSAILNITLHFITPKFQTLSDLDYHCGCIMVYLDKIIDNSEKNLRLVTLFYLENLILGYIEIAKRDELYEVLYNLRELEGVLY